jgi:hypothetical protein
MSFQLFIYPQESHFALALVQLSQTTRFDHHSTSVFAINTNHHLGVPFLIVTRYQYCHLLIFTSHNQLNADQSNGSFGTEFIHAFFNSVSIILTAIHHDAEPEEGQPLVEQSHGHIHLSHCDVTIADCICDNAVLRDTSLALHCADCILGISAAIRIPIITITISISTNVNALILFFFIDLNKK